MESDRLGRDPVVFETDWDDCETCGSPTRNVFGQLIQCWCDLACRCDVMCECDHP